MRIDPSTLSAVAAPTNLRVREPDPSPPVQSPSSVVSLGEAAASAAAPPLDAAHTERLGRLREMIAAGKYTVDLEQLASRILDDDMARSGRA